MIGKISPQGTSLESRVRYLYGPGKSHEHVDPHLVAGWRSPAELEPPLRPSGRRDMRMLIGLLLQPHAAMGDWGSPRPVWHCLLSEAPTDRVLSDVEWGDIAVDVMLRTGLSNGEDDEGVRWIAVRHAADHIHVVAMLARQDGRRPRLSFDRLRVRDACQAAEDRYGLRKTGPAWKRSSLA
ncbi:MAG TPA: hypothetical protein VKU77_39155 [Streptosporangiaceae bacterium]|nr:hypothetical protein [Streptosporangiaceae bacterium]